MIRALAIAFVLVLASACGLAWYLLATTGGAQRLLEFGAPWVPGELIVGDLEGSVWHGLAAGQVEYRQDDVIVVANAVFILIDPPQLLSGRLVVENATAESLTLNDLPVDLRIRLDGAAQLTAGLPLDANVEWVERPTAVAGRGHFAGTLDSLEFTHIVDLPERIFVDGTLESVLDAPAITANLRWDHLTLPEQDFGALVSRDGTATVDATPDAYRVSATTKLVRDDELAVAARLSAHGDTERLFVDELQLDGPGGRLTADGEVEFGDPPAVKLNVTSSDFDPGILLPGYGGRLSFDVTIDARWPQRLTVEVARLQGEFLGSPVRGSGDLLAADGKLLHANARLKSGVNALRVAINGTPRLSGEFEIDAPDLASLWPGLSGELRGSGSLTGTPQAPRITADLVGVDLGYAQQRAARLQIAGRADVDTGVDFVAGATDLRIGNQALGDLEITGRGTIESHTLDVELSGGLAETRFGVGGSWDGERLAERVSDAVIETAIGTWRLREEVAVTVAAGRTQVSAHCWDNAPASVCTEGLDYRSDELSAVAVLTRFPLQTLNPWLGGDITIVGEADATFAVQTGADGFDLDVTWRQFDTRLVFESAIEDMMAESEVETRLSSVELTLNADDDAAALSGSVVGAFGLTAAIDARLAEPLAADGALAGTVRAEVPDIGELRALIDRYVPTEGLAGALVVDVIFGGTRSVPTLAGSARLKDGSVGIPVFGITVDDVQVAVRARDDDRLELTGSARSGDGVIDLSGEIGLAADSGLYAVVGIQGDRFELVRLPDQSALISPDVTARFDGGRIELGGRVLVPEASFQFRELGDSAVTVSDDIVIHYEGQEAGEAASYARIAGQLDVALGDAVTFEGLGLRTRVTGGLLLTFRPGAAPAGEGALQLRDGTYDAFGREMQIERGSLNFYGPLDDPVVDARATRRFRYEAEDIKLGVNLSGRVSQQLDFVLFSEPAMSEADVLSFMVVGRPASNRNGDDGAVAGAALAMGLQSLSATRRVGDSLTLDEINFEGGGADDTSVVAGKQLSENWYIRYTYGLFNRVGTFIIRYDIGRGVSIEAGSGAQQSLDLLYSIDR